MTGELNGVIRAINSNIDQMARQLAGQIDAVGVEVGRSRQDLQLTRSELMSLRREFDAWVKQAERTAAVQESTTKVGNLKAQLDREFGHYVRVRHTSIGLLQAFDVGNVSNDVVKAVSEELMIQMPRYWLAPAIVALAAWSRDDPEMADKSIREAFSRDKNKTSLFFALILRRQGRLDASVRWLRHYLTSLDPNNLTREFAVILEATSYDAFGPAGQQLLAEVMRGWVSELRNSPEIVEKQIQSWVREIATNRENLAQGTYPTLAAISPDFPALVHQLEQSSALPLTLDKYEAIKAFDAPIPAVLESMLDDILEPLVTDYDEEELPLRREVVYHEAIIEERGDMVRAQERADLLQRALENTTDIVSLQTQAAINPELLGVSVGTQRMAIGVGADDFKLAVGRFCMAYRTAALSAMRLKFASNHSNYATTYGFPELDLHTAMPEDVAIAKIRKTWVETLELYISKLRFNNRWYIRPGIIVAIVALLAILIDPGFGLIVLAAGAGIVYFLGDKEKKAADAKIAAVEAARQAAIEYSVAIYRDATAQWVDGRLLYEELDAQESDLLALIETWPTAQHKKEDVA